MKEEKRLITIKNTNGENMEAELITYLISEDILKARKLALKMMKYSILLGLLIKVI